MVPEHYRITFIGALGVSAVPATETWSNTLNYRPVSVPVGEMSQGTADAVAAAALADAQGFYGSALFADDVWLTEARAYCIGTGGHASGPIGYAVANPAQAGTGSVSGRYLPNQVSWTLSLVADGRGKGKFGRIYLPCPVAAVAKDGRVTGTVTEQALNNMGSYLQTLDASLGTAFGNDVELIIVGSTGTAGTARPVRELRLGRVLDTQRRRRRSLDEAYSVVPYGT